MKKIIGILCMSLLLLASCKKEYTCTCVATSTDSNGNTSTNTDVTTIKDASSSQAKAACVEAKLSTTYPDGSEYSQECELTK